MLATVDARPAIVVATPGAEPVATGGYAAVVLLDTWLLLARSDLRATEEAVRRWANAAALVRPATDGGRVLCVGDASHPGLQALVRWDPSGLARREIEERQSAHLPPASRVATITGEPADLEQALATLHLPAGAEVLGPVPVEWGRESRGDESVRYVVRVPRASGAALSAASVRCRPTAPPASCRTSASRWTRPSWADPRPVVRALGVSRPLVSSVRSLRSLLDQRWCGHELSGYLTAIGLVCPLARCSTTCGAGPLDGVRRQRDAGPERASFGELQVFDPETVREQPAAAALYGGVGEQAVLVDEPGLDHGVRQRDAACQHDVPTRLLLE